VTSYSAAVLQP